MLDEILADEDVVTEAKNDIEEAKTILDISKSADIENRFAEEIVKRGKIYETETQPTVSEIAEALRRKRPSPVVEPEVVADGSSVESLEALIPERQPKPPLLRNQICKHRNEVGLIENALIEPDGYREAQTPMKQVAYS